MGVAVLEPGRQELERNGSVRQVFSPAMKWDGSSWKISGLVCHPFQVN
jgi:hypothetical protein